MTNSIGYDKTDPKSIEAYSQNLIGKTFEEIYENGKMDDETEQVVKEQAASYENKKRKGGLGEIVEERFFHYKANSDSRPDFPEAGVELKVTPYRINRNRSLSAKERLVVTMIDYMSLINETFYNSHFWIKSHLMLLVYYQYQQGITDRLKYRIDYAKLFAPPKEDLPTIIHDFEIILDKVKAGKAHEISGADTTYLEAAPKSADSSVRRKQPCCSILAKPRAFAFKNSYMTYVLNTYIVPGKVTYESILPTDGAIQLETYVVDKLREYQGWSVDELCAQFDISVVPHPPKNYGAMIAYRILGIKGNKAAEFEKANVIIKTIRIKKNRKIKESMSFPAFKFKELVEEKWETSTFGNYLRDTRFCFIVYKEDESGIYRLKGCQFWNIPYTDLEEHVKTVWKRTIKILNEGLKVEIKNGKHFSNLPKSSDDPVCHVRPHGIDSDDTDDLPTGGSYPKQCFWLNNSYILSQLNKELYE